MRQRHALDFLHVVEELHRGLVEDAHDGRLVLGGELEGDVVRIGGHGDDIANSLLNAANTKPVETSWGTVCEQLNNRNWCQHFFKELCKRDIDIEFIGHDDNCYCDYTYVVTGEYANYGGKINIDGATYLSRITVDVYAGSENDTKIFSGDADNFIDWISTVED